jgi:glycosyltransferase involved in cell wall biosynthesis/SAM-dependent methyltransferase
VPLRVAVVGPTYPYKGGIAAHTTELAHRLTGAGHDVQLVSWSAQYPSALYPGRLQVKEGDGEPFPNTSYPLSWRRPDGWLGTGRRLARSGFDLVVLVVVTPLQAPAYLALLRGVHSGAARAPHVTALCHNVLPHENRPGDRVLSRAVLGRCDSLLVHSSQQAELAASLTARPVHVAPLPPHLPVRVLAESGDDAGKAPRRHLLFFGIVRPYKGVDLLLRALADVPDVRLTVAGEFWGSTERYERLIGELGIGDRVTLLPGYVPGERIGQLFERSDALVLPYRGGTATQNVALAHAYRRPVVATTVATMAEQVDDGVDGLVVAPGDVGALARALTRLYDEPDLLPRLRAGVRAPRPDEAWAVYIRTLTDQVPPAEPLAAAFQTAAPPGGRLTAVAKLAAERLLWARVGGQLLVERVLGAAARPVPTTVARTAVLSRTEEWQAAVREARRLRLPLHPDRPKNWDALGAVAAVVSTVGTSARVLDAGSARYSPILPWLRLYGLRDLHGINLEFGAEVRHGPVSFRHGDVTATDFATGGLDAVTCMSVIEHGVPIRPFLAEAARVLRPGGVLVVSTDYDQTPQDTTGKAMYGSPVRIFGPQDVKQIVADADELGLVVEGELAFSHEQRPVHWKRMDLDYTFILLTFRRR